MALSEHDQTVLKQMEAGLRAGTAGSTGPLRTWHRASHRYVAAAIGLMTFGVGSVAVGLRLENKLGIGLGVVGFVLIVSSCWAAARSPLGGPGWLRAASWPRRIS
ncbi:MAG: DUF3040 domain-containing protein [Actinomycetota bacterium]|nr:DUF3040 domain-containing protein [Actinomycetota bacterium]